MGDETPTSTTTPAAPWRSEKIWLAVLGVAALTALALGGVIELAGHDVAGLLGALILGRAWEGAAARRAG